jgi:hypothetical protein
VRDDDLVPGEADVDHEAVVVPVLMMMASALDHDMT